MQMHGVKGASLSLITSAKADTARYEADEMSRDTSPKRCHRACWSRFQLATDKLSGVTVVEGTYSKGQWPTRCLRGMLRLANSWGWAHQENPPNVRLENSGHLPMFHPSHQTLQLSSATVGNFTLCLPGSFSSSPPPIHPFSHALWDLLHSTYSHIRPPHHGVQFLVVVLRTRNEANKPSARASNNRWTRYNTLESSNH